jgi:hypothetical protein
MRKSSIYILLYAWFDFGVDEVVIDWPKIRGTLAPNTRQRWG